MPETKSTTTTDRKDTTMNAKTDSLQHADWCRAERIETTDYPSRGITTTHCLDCGAHEAKDSKGRTLNIPSVTGGLYAEGKGDMDVTMEKAPTKGGAL